MINCYFTFTTKRHIPDWSMIDIKCKMFMHKEHALDNLNDVLQVYVVILPIDNNTYKLRNTVYDIQKLPIPERGSTVSENIIIVPLGSLLLRYYIKVLFGVKRLIN